MLKPHTKDMESKQKLDLLTQTFERLHVDPEHDVFQDVIIELAAEINYYRNKIHKLQYGYEEKMQRHEKMFDDMKKKIIAKDPCDKHRDASFDDADLEAPFINICGDVYFTINHFTDEPEGDADESDA